MRRLLVGLGVLLIASLPLTAGAWTLPVPSGLTAGEHVRASDTSTLGNYGHLGMNCTSRTFAAGVVTPIAGISCILADAAGPVTMTSITETGAVAGQILIIINVDATPDNITINESAGVNEQGGNIVLGQYDSLTYIYTGSTWVELSLGNN